MLKALEKEIEKIVREDFGEEVKIELETTPDISLGDFGTSICFRLAKKLKNSPQEIAEDLAEKLRKIELVKDTKAVNGYLNVFLDRKKVLEKLFSESLEFGKKHMKIIVEHTAVNPNKAMHVGHLRNACLGDSIARVLKFFGYEVEVQNYVDDTGMQVAATILGLIGRENIEKIKDEKFLEKMKAKVEEIAKKEKLDIYCWDIYSQVYEKYTEEEISEYLRVLLREIEHVDSPLHKFAKWFAERILECHLETLKKLDISFDLLPRESDILALGFWKKAFEVLKNSENFVYEQEGKNQGCWVIKLGKHENFSHLKDPDKIIVKSDGTVTYTGKDIAYHFWKFGILGKDFFYRRFTPRFPDTWITESSVERAEKPERKFGKADKIINVIDIRQKYAQDVVKYSMEVLGYKKQAENYIHYGYEVVALSPKSMKELESIDRKYIHMSGRKGIGVKADDLIRAMVLKAEKEIEKRYGKSSVEQAEKIMRAALRYYMIKQNITKVLVFDLDEAMRFEGDSGVYLLYALVRAKNILKNSSKNAKIGELEDTEWKLVRKMIEWKRVISNVERTLDLTLLTDYANELAKTFTEFYHECRVIGDEREEIRIAVVESFVKLFSKLLWIIGIPELEKM